MMDMHIQPVKLSLQVMSFVKLWNDLELSTSNSFSEHRRQAFLGLGPAGRAAVLKKVQSKAELFGFVLKVDTVGHGTLDLKVYLAREILDQSVVQLSCTTKPAAPRLTTI